MSKLNIAKNGYIVDNSNNAVLAKAEHEFYINAFSKFTLNEICNIFNRHTLIPVFRLYLLDDDENIIKDISQDMLSGDLTRTYQTGKRCTLTANLLNGHGKYTPANKNYEIYLGCKLRFDAGMLINNDIYWFQQGIFILKDMSFSSNDSEQTVTFNLHDKFALFDGTIRGTSALKTIVPVGVPMKQAFINILGLDNGTGKPYDKKPIIFNTEYATQNTYKTIKTDFNSNYGAILIDSANTISSDVYYNAYGNMVVKSNVNEFLQQNLPVVFRINDGDRILYNKSISYNWDKLRNRIIVKGAITNGYQFTATADNTNLFSLYNVNNGRYGVRSEVVSDPKLYSDTLCMEKAMYTLVERQRGVKTLSLSLGYIPFLDVNQSILVTLSDYDLNNANYVIDSISMSISDTPSVSLQLSNIGDVVFK